MDPSDEEVKLFQQSPALSPVWSPIIGAVLLTPVMVSFAVFFSDPDHMVWKSAAILTAVLLPVMFRTSIVRTVEVRDGNLVTEIGFVGWVLRRGSYPLTAVNEVVICTDPPGLTVQVDGAVIEIATRSVQTAHGWHSALQAENGGQDENGGQ